MRKKDDVVPYDENDCSMLIITKGKPTKMFVIYWCGYGCDHIDLSKIFTSKDKADAELKRLMVGLTSDMLPEVRPFELTIR